MVGCPLCLGNVFNTLLLCPGLILFLEIRAGTRWIKEKHSTKINQWHSFTNLLKGPNQLPRELHNWISLHKIFLLNIVRCLIHAVHEGWKFMQCWDLHIKWNSRAWRLLQIFSLLCCLSSLGLATSIKNVIFCVCFCWRGPKKESFLIHFQSNDLRNKCINL